MQIKFTDKNEGNIFLFTLSKDNIKSILSDNYIGWIYLKDVKLLKPPLKRYHQDWTEHFVKTKRITHESRIASAIRQLIKYKIKETKHYIVEFYLLEKVNKLLKL